MAYVDCDYYKDVYKGSALKDALEKYLNKASRQIDALTFNRIKQVGFENLSEFQKTVIQEVNCELADFLFENEEMLTSYVTDYSLNGVSMKFGEGMNLVVSGNGVTIPRELLGYLEQSGLCCLSFRYSL